MRLFGRRRRTRNRVELEAARRRSDELEAASTEAIKDVKEITDELLEQQYEDAEREHR